MGILWEWLEKKKMDEESKMQFFLFLNTINFGIIGFLVWLVVSRFALHSLTWALCFIGYSGFFIGYIGGFIFSCRK